MKINFCTLFDHNYLDRGMVLYNSLIDVCPDFCLYIVAFDDDCYKTINNLKLDKLVLIDRTEFEDESLENAKSNRSNREYLWTCSSFCIKYVFDVFKVSNCTYIDSDLRFFSDPTPYIEQFIVSDYDVAIIPHNYSDHLEYKYLEKLCGEYCVEFNTFKNTNNSLNVLKWWCDRCYECCTEKPRDGMFGDQKYIEKFAELFKGIYKYEYKGLGVAPWNVDDYIYVNDTRIYDKKSDAEVSLVFYHFHSIDFGYDSANINVYKRPGKKDDALIDWLYNSYINEIYNFRKSFDIKNKDNKPSSNRVVRSLKYAFSEKNIITAVCKIYRLIMYGNKDYFYVN